MRNKQCAEHKKGSPWITHVEVDYLEESACNHGKRLMQTEPNIWEGEEARGSRALKRPLQDRTGIREHMATL